MTITPINTELSEPRRFGSDEELFAWMRQNTKGKYATAKAAVNDWWKSVTESLYYADIHFGWDALDPDSCSGKVMPPELNDWCVENGLDTPAKIYKARAIYRASLLTNSPIEYLIDEVGVSKAQVIGRRSKDEQSANNLLHVAQAGATKEQLRKQPIYQPTSVPAQSVVPRDLKDSNETVEQKDQEIAELKDKLEALTALQPALSAENQRLKSQLSAAQDVKPEVITKVETKTDRKEINRLEARIAELTQQLADVPRLPEGGAAALSAQQTCEAFSVQIGHFHGALSGFISVPKESLSAEFIDQIRNRLVAINTDIDKFLNPATISILPTTIDV